MLACGMKCKTKEDLLEVDSAKELLSELKKQIKENVQIKQVVLVEGRE